MPIYEYELAEGDCSICQGRFELRRPLSRPDLTNCPLCKRAVRKVVSSVSAPNLTRPISITDAKKAGFTILERKDKGTYERL